MLRVIIAESSGQWTWWLQAEMQASCDVLVRGIGTHPNEAVCRQALHSASRAIEVDPQAALPVQTSDGYWHVRFHDTCGRPVATSANHFPTARASGLEIGRLTKALTALCMVVASASRRPAPWQADQHCATNSKPATGQPAGPELNVDTRTATLLGVPATLLGVPLEPGCEAGASGIRAK
jgi:hypothetical protein